MRLILASSSPYRKAMLERLGLPFQTVSPNVDESPLPGEAPGDLATRLSVAKARAVAEQHPDAVVIGSDQVATLDGTLLGKPGSFEAARQQLLRLSGNTATFHSGLCVLKGSFLQADDILTHCRFRKLTPDEIDNYLRKDEPFDTAGSAKAESLGIALLESLRADDPTAIVGLPLIALTSMLRAVGLNPLG